MTKTEKPKIDFIGIGAQKAGTTWLFQMLKEHPEVCGSESKEVRFFNKNMSSNSFNWYQKHFSHCPKNKIKGEFTTQYLYDNQAAKLIQQNYPNVKLIVVLRNPIERTYSAYKHNLRKHPELKKQFKSFENSIHQQKQNIIEYSLYYKHLKKYFEKFSKENIKIIIYEDLKEKPIETMQNLYSFLRVNPNFTPPSHKTEVNPAGHWKIKKLTALLHKGYRFIRKHPLLYKIFQKFKLIKAGKKIKEINREKAGKKYKEINPQTKNFLYQNYFKKDIENLEKLINKDLSLWKKNNLK